MIKARPASDSKTPEGRSTSSALRIDVEEFLIFEADLLDRWRLIEWLGLFDEDATYLVPATDHRDPDFDKDLVLVQDNRFLLEQRVQSLLTRSAHAEYPHSRTRRLVTNVRARELDDGTIEAVANFAVYRMRLENVDTYIGRYRHILAGGGSSGYRFKERRAVVDLDALRPHGKISIIL